MGRKGISVIIVGNPSLQQKIQFRASYKKFRAFRGSELENAELKFRAFRAHSAGHRIPRLGALDATRVRVAWLLVDHLI